MSLEKNLQQIHFQIEKAAKESGRSPREITLVAVSKMIHAEKIRQAFALEVNDFAENYTQEALAKQESLSDLKLNWHFIGQLQSNKVKQVVNRFTLIHSVDRLKVANEISQRAQNPQKILLEVSLVGEKSKSGCAASELSKLIEQVQKLKNLQLLGLMFMPPLGLNLPEQERYFSAARDIRDKAMNQVNLPHSLIELSMGTSHDFQAAIRFGATLVRLGTILFGERQRTNMKSGSSL